MVHEDEGGARPRRWGRPTGASLKKDVPAGVVLGVESVPDGLAGGLLAGVNPVYGLYGYMFGTLFGAAATSSAFMAVQATGAMAVVVSDVPQVHGGGDRADTALFTLTMLTGVVMLVLGLARLGWVVRWVPNAVLTGFINAVAVNIVLGQLANFTGYQSAEDNRVQQAVDTAISLPEWSWPAALIGAVTVVLIVLLDRTRLGAMGMVLAIVASSALAFLVAPNVPLLNDITEVPGSLPSPGLPDLGLVASLLVPAVSLAFVGLVQGAAISSSVPNPDGRYPDPSGDFRGQGIANLGTGLLQGMPVGGSMSATSIVTGSGARSRLALFVAGVTMVVAVLVLSDLVGYVAMPALAGLLVVVGVRTFKTDEVLMVWRTGPVQRSVMAVTFGLTLLIPLQYAVLVGVGMSIVLYVARQSNQVDVRQWIFHPDGTVSETDPPTEVGIGEVLVLRPYGSLFFAAAAAFEKELPEVTAATRGSAVVITLRGKENLGSTFIKVLTRYAQQLGDRDSIVIVSGASERVIEQLRATGADQAIGDILGSTDVMTASTRAALASAEEWVAAHRRPGPGDESSDGETAGGAGG
ncbi:MAG: SulP family inorganic anion transporter [Nocardioides sp.]